jgi:hypothetical protein
MSCVGGCAVNVGEMSAKTALELVCLTRSLYAGVLSHLLMTRT